MDKRVSNLHRFAILLLGMMLSASFAIAQSVEVKGTVTDTDGNPLPAVNVIEQGTLNGATTNMDGQFTLRVGEPNAILEVTYIGFAKQVIPLDGRTDIEIILMEDTQLLDEVVVVGYGTQDKDELTGAVSRVTSEDFNVGVVTSPENLIEGKISGVQVFQNSGEPGAGATIRIRGAASVRSGNSPLYVVDGVPLDIKDSTPGSGDLASGIGEAESKNPLNFLNPDDIESIDILKDASATAIYGARGANGVVIITTKKGKEGAGQLDYSSYVSVAQLRERIDVLSADEFRDYINSPAFAPAGQDPASFDFGAATDWQDAIFRSAITNNHNLAFSGGNSSTTYRASVSYMNQEGIIEKSAMNRYTARVNAVHNAMDDKLTVRANLTFSETEDNRVPVGSTGGFEGDVILNALRQNPTRPIYNPDGTFAQDQNQAIRNPLAMIELTDDVVETGRTLTNLGFDYDVTDDLTAQINLGLDRTTSERRISQSPRLNYQLGTRGSATISTRDLESRLFEAYANYSKGFGEHTVNALAGFSYQWFSERGLFVNRTGFAGDEIDLVDNIALGDTEQAIPFSYRQENEIQSVFARVNYIYKGRYIVTANFRRDGSTKFGANNKYGNFPSFAATWRIIEEDFMEDQDIFSDLKFRFGWGRTGNQEIPNKITQATVGGDNGTRAFFNGQVVPGLTFLRTPNPDLRWETTDQINIGFDFGFADDRFTGSIDYFNKTTTDILLEITAPAPSTAPTIWTNVDGELVNAGVEGAISANIIETKDFQWSADLNMTFLHNEVNGLPISRIETGAASGQGLSGTQVQVITNGQPLGTFFGRVWEGRDAEGNDIYKLDENGQPVREFLGSAIPDMTWGLTQTFRYKRFDANIFINGAHGHQVYNNTANSIWNKPTIRRGENVPSFVLDSDESFENILTFSSRFIEDADFVRLNNVTVGYNVDVSKLDFISRLRVYATGTNLLLFTDYSGYDPEVNTGAGNAGVPSLGVDFTNFPRPRTFQIGVNMSF